MISFPNAKINLGLNITEKRPDGFHNIETVFYPIGWNDALEIIEQSTSSEEFSLHLSGIPIAGKTEDNLLYKAYQILKKEKNLPSLDVYLHKAIPMGAGLGGGSADAAFFVNLINERFDLGFNEEQRMNIARQLGSDCAFFIKNKPVFAFEKGDLFKEIDLDLSQYQALVIYPNVHSNTKEAYSLVKPSVPSKPILEILKQPVTTWKEDLKNDFENSIVSKYPLVKEIKQELYKQGALYASMSGSGSAVYGIFNQLGDLNHWKSFPYWYGKL